MAPTILVTGATGFIGRYVVVELLRRGVRVVASSARPARAERFSWYPEVRYLPFDFEQFDPATDYYSYFGQPDAMIHLAWEGLPDYRAAFHLERNLPRHRLLLTNLLEHGLRDLTVTGTCFEYGMQEGCLREDMACHPDNAYAAAKNQLRIELEAATAAHHCVFRWMRLFYMYGRGQHERSLIPQLEQALERGDAVFNMSGGEQVRDFLPVEQVAEYIVCAALQQRITGVINCCSGQPVTVKQFIGDYLAARGKSIQLNTGYYPYPDYEPMRFWGDPSRLQQCLRQD